MKPREAVHTRPEPGTRQGSIPSRLTLTVVPIAVVTLLLGVFLVWTLVSSDVTAGLSWVNVSAVAIAVVVVLVCAGTLLVAHRQGKAMSARVGELTDAARRVASKDLLELLDTPRITDPELDPVAPIGLDTRGDDEIADLATSFEELHRSLIEVAARQMEALRAGVSSIFVTLARRNSSLVDRQLALLDQLEAREEDPETLSGYYQLDHLATRMRRNAESLLVLAGSESPRVWAKATQMFDVVRAAASEIDEYQRIEVLALEPARLSGGSVSDVSHLIAELLENAIQFSPPSEMVRITGLFDKDGYQIAVSDRGVGMSDARLAEMNRILARPPALGLAVEPTLGMYVVAKLAHRHGLAVELIRGVPGITARVTIPRDHLEIEDKESRPFDAEHTEKLASKGGSYPSPDDYSDTETRAYVFKRQKDRMVEEPVPMPAGDPVHVVDLTETEPAPEDQPADPGGEAADERQPATGTEHEENGSDRGPVELPVRTPGVSFDQDDDPDHRVSPGEGASRIKSALSAYDRGRRSANDEQRGSGPDESGSEDSS
ncbi:MAG TPA: ATP-binding protein [Acidimicrobiia bacterium]|nr:ATP-binding protein [Acidimicrobiia bacterium]